MHRLIHVGLTAVSYLAHVDCSDSGLWRTVFELMYCLAEQVTFIPGKRQRQFAPLLFKALTQQASIEAYRIFICLPIY